MKEKKNWKKEEETKSEGVTGREKREDKKRREA